MVNGLQRLQMRLELLRGRALRKSQDDAGFGPFVVTPTVVLVHPVDPYILEDTHDRLEEVGNGLGVFGAAFFVHDFPLVGHLVGDVLVQKIVGRVRVGPIDFVGVSLAVLGVPVLVVVAGGQRGFAEAVISLTLFFLVLFLTAKVIVIASVTSSPESR